VYTKGLSPSAGGRRGVFCPLVLRSSSLNEPSHILVLVLRRMATAAPTSCGPRPKLTVGGEGAHKEQGQVRGKEKHVAKTKKNHDEAVSHYVL